MQKTKKERQSKTTVLSYVILSIILLFLLPLSSKKELDIVKPVKEINNKINSSETFAKLSVDGKQFYEKWCERSKRSMDESRVLFRKVTFGISEFGRYSKILFHAIFNDSGFADSRGSD